MFRQARSLAFIWSFLFLHCRSLLRSARLRQAAVLWLAVLCLGGAAIAGLPVLTLNTSATPTTVGYAGTLTYTLRYANNGAVPATNATLTDIIPPYLQYVAGSATGGGTYAPATRTVSWALGTVNTGIPGGQTVTFQVSLMPDAPVGTQIINQASISCTEVPTPVTATAAFTVASAGPGDWSMFHRDAQRTGRSPYLGSSTSTTKTGWPYNIGAAIYSSPVLGADGTIYVGAYDSNLHALTPAGIQKWAFPTGAGIRSSPAVGPDGTIYVTAQNNTLYAVTDNGASATLKWSFAATTGISSSPVIGSDGTIYFGAGNFVYALTDNGNAGIQKWKYTLNNGDTIGQQSPAVGTDGAVYIGSTNDYLYAINPDGSKRWTYQAGGSFGGFGLSIGADGTVYIGCQDDNLYAINSAGMLKWTYKTNNQIWSTPAIAKDGTLYFGSSDSNLYCLADNGNSATKNWSYTASGGITSSPAIGTDGTIYFTSTGANNGCVALNANGTVKWINAAVGGSFSSPAIAPDGSLYLGSEGGVLYAIGGTPNPTPIISLTKTVTPNSAKHGDVVQYTLKGVNNGTVAATNATLTDLLPAHVTYVPGSATGGGVYVPASDAITWSAGTIDPGTNAQVSFQVTVDPDAVVGIPISNAASFVCAELPTPASSNTASFIVTAAPSPVLTLSKTVAPPSAGLNTSVLYTLTYGNSGVGTASNVTLIDTLPAHVTYVPGSANGGGIFNAGTNTITWSLGTLTAGVNGQTVSFQATVNLDAVAGSPIANTATIACTELAQPVTSNAASFMVTAPVFTVSKSVLPTSAGAGYTVTYTLTSSNNGAETATNVTLADVLPAHLTYVPNSATGGGSYNAGTNTLTWTMGMLAPGANGPTVSFQAVVKADAVVGTQITNTAGMASTEVPTPVTSTAAIFTVIVNAPGDWWMFHRDIKHTGCSPFTGPSAPLQKWAFATGGSILGSSPAIGMDGAVYLGSADGNLYAINPDGSQRWAFKTGAVIQNSSPAMGADGTIYIGSNDKKIYAVNPDGTVKWAFTTGNFVSASPTIGTDGTIYVGSLDKNLYALNPDGSLKWSYAAVWAIGASSPAIATDGTIYFGDKGNRLYALNANGTLKWLKNVIGLQSSPALATDGTVYIGSEDGNLYAIDTTGKQKWALATGGMIDSTPAVGTDGTIYVGSADKKLYAVNANGTQKWAFVSKGAINSSPLIGADGVVYVGSEDRTFYAVNTNGSQKWSFTTGGFIDSSPALGSDGTLYIGSNDTNLYAITQGTPLPALSLTKAVVPTTSPRNGQVTYNLSYINNGSQAASNVTITDVLPPNVTWVSGGSYSPGTNTVSWSLGSVGVGGAPQTVSFLVTVNSDAPLGANIANTAAISCTEVPTSVVSNIANLTVTIPLPVLVLAKSALPISAGAGATVTYTLNYGNNVTDATNVQITDILPANVTYVPGSATGNASYSIATNTLTWAIGAVNAGDVGQVAFQVTINTNAPVNGKIGNIAGINCYEAPTPVVSNTANVTVLPAAGRGDWWMYHHDVHHTGLSPFNGPTIPTQKWAFTTGNQIQNSSAAIGADGGIFIGSTDMKLYAINPDGTPRWSYLTGGTIVNSPAIATDGTIYFGSNDSKLYAINPDGTKKWIYTAGGGLSWSSPAIGTDGTVYIGSQDNKLYAVSAAGVMKWVVITGGHVDSSPAIGADGTIYFASEDKKVYAVTDNGASYTQKWAYTTGAAVTGHPTIGNDGTLYIGSTDGSLYALTDNGASYTVKWSYATGGINSTPAIGKDGSIIVRTTANNLYSLSPAGAKNWMSSIVVASTPVVGADGTIYVGSTDNNLYALNPADGSKKWGFLTGQSVGASPSIGADGTLYIGSQDNNLYAINSWQQPQLTLTKAVSLSKPHRSDVVTYTLTYGNSGALPATGVILTDVLPANVDYVPGSATGGGNYDAGTNSITWALGGLAVGAAPLPLTFQVTVSPTAPFGTQVDNNAGIYCTEVTTPVVSNTASLTVTAPLPVLQLTKSAHPTSVGPGGTIRYTLDYGITVFTATGVAINDVLPANVSYVPNSATGNGVYDAGTNSLTWTLGTVNMGTTGEVSFLVTINADTAPGSIISNIAGIASIEVPTTVMSNTVNLTVATTGPGDWWMFMHDRSHTSRSGNSGPLFPAQKWALATGGVISGSSPAIGFDGTIYIGSNDHNLYAVSSGGIQQWMKPTGDVILSSPAVGADGTVYVGSHDGKLYSFAASGTQNWAAGTGGAISSSPAVNVDGTVYVGSNDGKLSAFNPDGSLQWTFTTGSAIYSSPAVAADGTILVGSTDGKLYAVNADGSLKWTYTTGNAVWSSPTIGTDGSIYVGSDDWTLYALNPDGSKKWLSATGDKIRSSPALAADGSIIVGSNDGSLYAFTAGGVPRWVFASGAALTAPAAIGGDGTIYVGSSDHNVYALDPSSGTVKWLYPTGAAIDTCPAIGADGTVYVGSNDQKLYALTLGTPQYQSDLRIGATLAGSIGQNVINATGSGQTIQQFINIGASATCYVTVANASNIADIFTLHGTEQNSSGVWTTQYFDNDTQADVTASAVAGQLVVPLAPNGKKVYRAEITGMTTNTTDTLTVTATSNGDGSKVDVVKEIVTAYNLQPDLAIGPTIATTIGQTIFNLDAANQTIQQWPNAGQSAICYLTIANAGTTADTFLLHAVDAGGTGWAVQYFDNISQANVTGSATAGTLAVTLGIGAQQIYRAEITGATPATTDTITVTATSVIAPAKQDVVKNVVTVNKYLPDLWIGTNAAATAAIGQSIFNTTGLNQTITQWPNAGQSAICYVTVNNVGNTADSYQLQAVDAGGTGWTVQYFDNDTQANVTGALTAGTLNLPLLAGAQKIYRTEMVGTVQGATDTMTLSVASQSDGTKQDVVKAIATVNAYQPDLWIGTNTGASAAIGQTIYNLTGVNQSLQQYNDANNTTIHYISVNNVGNTADTYTLLATATASITWTVQYFDNDTQVDVTASATAGTLLVSLPAGGQKIYRSSVVGLIPGAVDTLTIRTTSQSDGTKQDVVNDTVTLNEYQPDLWIGVNAGATAAIGQAIYNGTGLNQTLQQWSDAGKTATCYLTVNNVGNTADTYTLLATATGGAGWTVQYFDNDTQANVTASATAGTLTVSLPSGAQKLYRAAVIGTTQGTADTITFKATSQHDATKRDVVKDIVTVNQYQPDLWIGANAGASSAIGQLIYNTTGLNQTLQQWNDAGNTATCYLTVNNVGNTADTFLLSATDAGGTGWTVQYFDNDTQANVTASATAGQLSVSLLAGAQKLYRVTAVGLVKVTTDTITMTATSQSDGTKQDVVKEAVTINGYQPDLWIGANTGASAAIGQMIFNTTGVNQTISQWSNAGKPATGYITVNNVGNTADTFTLLGTDTGGAGWTVQYFDNASGSNVTASAVAGQLTVSLLAGAQKVYRAAITGTTPGATDTVTITATSQADATRQDVVKDIMTVNQYQPDLTIGTTLAGEIGQGIFTADGTNQTVAQSVNAKNTATYYLLVQNTGNTADSYTLTGTAGNANWTVNYLAKGGTQNITTAATTGGWTTPVLAPGATADCWATVVPGLGAIGGSNLPLLITTKSTGDATKLDAVKAVTTVLPQYQPDMQLRNSADSTYTGVNILLPDLVEQTKSQTVNSYTTAIFPLRVQNNGNTTDSFILLGPGTSGGWTVQYFNALTGGSAVTAQFIGGGWSSGALAPGAVRDLRVEITPDNTIAGGGNFNVQVTGTSAADGTKKDAVLAVTTVMVTCLPDMLVRTSAETGFTGGGIYNLTGTGQMKSLVTPANQPVSYIFRVQNNGNTADTFTLTGPAATTGWTVQYFNASGTNITGSITAGGWKTALLLPGAYQEITAQVTPSATLPNWAAFTVLLKATSTLQPTQADVAEAITSLLTYQPDVAMSNYGDATFTGVGIYNLTGTNQTTTQTIPNAVMATYIFRVQNTGNTTDSFTITAAGAGTGWKLQYVDISTGADITSTITKTGWKTIALAPGSWLRYTIHVTPDTTLTGGAALTLTITAASNTLVGNKDVAKATTTVVTKYQPDLTIKNPTDASYTGVGIYNLTGVGQSRGLSSEIGGEVSYLLQVRNAGSTTDKFTVTMPPATAGWRIQLVDQATGADITTAATGKAGWVTKALAPGAITGYNLHVWPGSGLASGTMEMRLITAASATSPANGDAVQANSTFTLVHQPDLLIENLGDVAYVGGGVYNATGVGQTKIQRLLTGVTETYLIEVQNAGLSADNFTLSGATPATGWTLQYFNAANGGSDISGQMMAGTWTTGVLQPGKTTFLRVQATSSANASYITPCLALVTAVSTGNKLATDAVLVNAQRIGPLATTPWAIFHHDLQHSGRSAVIGSATNAQKWAATTGGVYSSPVIGVDGTVFIGGLNSKLLALQPATGAQKWAFSAGGSIQATPAVSADGSIYVGALDGNLYAVNADGTTRWSYPTGGPIYASAAIASDGTVYVAANDSKLYAVNADGTLKWTYILGTPLASTPAYSSPALGTDGTIYVGSRDGKLYAFKPTGALLWTCATGNAIFSSPAMAADGTIYIGSSDQKLYAVNANGSLKWYFNTQGAVNSTPAIAADGTIVFGSYDQKIYAISPLGGRKWTYTTNNWVVSSPAIDAAGNVYVGSLDGTLYAFTATGATRWTMHSSNWIYSSPAIGADGTVYFGSYDGHVYAIGAVAAGVSSVTTARPDLWIRLSAETAYAGVGIVNTDGANQTKSQTAALGASATYLCQVSNNGTAAGQFLLTGSGSASGWLPTYYDTLTTEDITASMTGAGWLTVMLAPGETRGFYVQVQPGAKAKLGTPFTVKITAVTASDATKTDVVKAVTTRE